MPVHLPHRRRFLLASTAGLVACSSSSADEGVEPDLVYLLNDTHIGEKHPADSPVPSHLRRAVQEIVDRPAKPAAVLINGDLALKDGQPGDYRHLGRLVAPLQRAEIAVHLTLGNHDNRETFYRVMLEPRPQNPPIKSRHISVVQTRLANFFLLDSLKETMVTQGTLGGRQLEWLAKALDAHTDKPALIVTHHNPRLGGDPNHFAGGLIDSRELWQVLVSRRHVKAYIHGHIHDRSNATHHGIHIVNTPATSYVADAKLSTTGWTVATLTPEGIRLTTRTTDESHAWNGQQKTLRWRT